MQVVTANFSRKLERERDEWAAMCGRYKQERDEARAVAGELADVASKYLSFLLAVTPIKANEIHEKDTMKVIASLKRWKKLQK